MITTSVVLTALYLRRKPGKPSVSSRGWPLIVQALRQADASIGSASATLREAGLWAESAALEKPGLLASSEALVQSGSVLTTEHPEYPQRWLSVLGAAAPTALWQFGALPAGPFLTIVGSRIADSGSLLFARKCAETGCGLGYTIASGAAIGCDAAAAEGVKHGKLLEIVPFGPKPGECFGAGHCVLSVAAPGEAFSSALAMERNTLLYALSDHTIIGHARFREGGSWHGAVDARRRRLCQLIVRDDPCNPAHLALVALGAKPLVCADGLASALETPPPKPLIVREARHLRLAWSGGPALL